MKHNLGKAKHAWNKVRRSGVSKGVTGLRSISNLTSAAMHRNNTDSTSNESKTKSNSFADVVQNMTNQNSNNPKEEKDDNKDIEIELTNQTQHSNTASTSSISSTTSSPSPSPVPTSTHTTPSHSSPHPSQSSETRYQRKRTKSETLAAGKVQDPFMTEAEKKRKGKGKRRTSNFNVKEFDATMRRASLIQNNDEFITTSSGSVVRRVDHEKSKTTMGGLTDHGHLKIVEKMRLMKENKQYVNVERTMRHVNDMSIQLNQHVEVNTNILERILRHQKKLEQRLDRYMMKDVKGEEGEEGEEEGKKKEEGK